MYSYIDENEEVGNAIDGIDRTAFFSIFMHATGIVEVDEAGAACRALRGPMLLCSAGPVPANE